MKTPRIIIGGNIYECGNIGDDAVLAGILQEVKRTIPDSALCIETHKGQPLPFVKESCEWVDCYDRTAVFAKIRKCDVYVVGGGTMIGDELSLRFPLEHLAVRVAYAKWLGKRVLFAGVGANRLKTAQGRRLATGLVKLADLMSCRDEASAAVCRDLCPERTDHIRTHADPAYLLAPERTERTERMGASFAKRGPILGINVLNEAWGKLKDYKQAIAGACNILHRKHGLFPVFFCNEIRTDAYFDIMANIETAAMLSCPHRILYPEYLTPAEMMDVIGRFDAVLSLRMHGLIFAAVAGTPFAGISRIDKVDNFMGQFGLKACGSIENVTAEAIVASVESALAECQSRKTQMAAEVALLRKRASGLGDCFAEWAGRAGDSRPQLARELLPYLEDVPLWRIRVERWRQGDIDLNKFWKKWKK
jgi:polysaccharide pyruvyl transferase WcaK-like protein